MAQRLLASAIRAQYVCLLRAYRSSHTRTRAAPERERRTQDCMGNLRVTPAGGRYHARAPSELDTLVRFPRMHGRIGKLWVVSV